MTRQPNPYPRFAVLGAGLLLTTVVSFQPQAQAQDRPPPGGIERDDADGFGPPLGRRPPGEFGPGAPEPGGREPRGRGSGEPGKGSPRGPEGPFGPGGQRGPMGDGRRPPPPGGHMPPHEWERLQEEDPEMYALLVEDTKLERQTLEVASRARRAAGDEREKLKLELAAVVGKHFETRQRRRALQLKRMEEEIERLREAIETRNQSRDKIVEERIQELVAEVDPLDF